VLESAFTDSVRLACEMDMVGLALQAVDGTKIRSHGSFKSSEKASDYQWFLEAARERASELRAEIEAAQDDPSLLLPAQLNDAEKLASDMELHLAEFESTGTKFICRVDESARVMKCSEGQKLCQNAQAVVDEKCGIVVASEVTNEANDSGQLFRMIEAAEEATGMKCQMSLADGGYHKGELMQALSQSGRDVLVSPCRHDPEGSQKVHSWEFEFDPATKCLTCPLGEQLVAAFERVKDGVPVTVYRCLATPLCPAKDSCTDHKNRTVDIASSRQAVVNNYRFFKSEQGQELYKKRKSIVEMRHGWIKRTFGLRRLEHGKPESIATFLKLADTTANLGKIYRKWAGTQPSLA
jgi:hypothetical protein